MGSPVCPGCGGLQVHIAGCLNASQRIMMRVVELLIEASHVDYIAENRGQLSDAQRKRLHGLAESKRKDAARWERSG